MYATIAGFLIVAHLDIQPNDAVRLDEMKDRCQQSGAVQFQDKGHGG